MAAPRLTNIDFKVDGSGYIGTPPKPRPEMPATLKIGAFVYTMDTKAPNLMRGATGAYGGLHSSRYKSISLDLDQCSESTKGVSLHEVVHGILDNAGLDVRTERDNGVIRYTEEDFISALTPGLLGFLRDNPAYLTWLLDSTTD